MPQASKTFRIFVSSTFSDLKAERNALQEHVFPKLRDLCAQHGCRFQAIDLRWGIRDEAALDQQTMKICLEEIARCQRTTPRPNFIVLLGDRYGWRPLPAEIPATEFEEIQRQISRSADEAFLKQWYKRDDNAVPPVYCLQPREGEYAAAQKWESTEDRLRRNLIDAVGKLALLETEELKYLASATEQEIVNGALSIPDAREHVFCFFRKLNDFDFLAPQGRLGREFYDASETQRLADEARAYLLDLKERLRRALGKNVHEYRADWRDGRLSQAHIGKLPATLGECMKLTSDSRRPPSLCEDVWRSLSRVILDEIARLKEMDPLETEAAEHEVFGADRSKHFVGRADSLQKVTGYVGSARQEPLVIFGASGSGKSAFMARAAADTSRMFPNAVVITRFIGATPASSDGQGLLEGICQEISRRLDPTARRAPADYESLIQEFPKVLSLATSDKPIIVFLDALDQLSNTYNARNLKWLPAELSAKARVVVSTTPGDCLSALENKVSRNSLVELQTMPVEEGGTLLDLWLKDAGRTLQPEQRQDILERFAENGLPLYLRLAFEEARRWPSFRGRVKLERDVPGILRDMFRRLEEHHGKMLVSHGLGHLAAARNGLTEDEILEVLAMDREFYADFEAHAHHDLPEMDGGRKLPVALWSRLYFDLEPYLTERTADGVSLLSFYHRQLSEAVVKNYLAGVIGRERHRILAEFFRNQNLKFEKDGQQSPNVRKVAELPFHQTRGELWKDLEQTLCDLDFVEAKCAAGRAYDLAADYDAALSAKAFKRDQHPGVEEFGRWVRTDARLLAAEPKLVFQEAVNEPDKSRPARQAILKWERGEIVQPWLRLLNKSQEEEHFLMKLGGHTDSVAGCAFSPDGNKILSASEDGTLKLWDAATGEELATMRQKGEYDKPLWAFEQDGTRIISANSDGQVRVWDSQSGAEISSLVPKWGKVLACGFTEGQERFITQARPLGWFLKVRNGKTGKRLFSLRGFRRKMRVCAISPRGDCIASASDRTLNLWSAVIGKRMFAFSGFKNPITGCGFTGDGSRVFAINEKEVRLWDTLTGDELPVVARASNIALSCDGKRLVGFGSSGMTLRTTASGRRLARFTGQNQVTACAFSPDGKRLVSASSAGSLMLWEAVSRPQSEKIKPSPPGVNRVRYIYDHLLPYTTRIHTTPVRDPRFWDDLTTGSTRTENLQFEDVGWYHPIYTFSPDETRVVASTNKGTALWDSRSNKKLAELEPKGELRDCCFSPDGSMLVTGSEDKMLKLWDAVSGSELAALRGHGWGIYGCVFSLDGSRILSTSSDGTRIWDARNGREIGSFEQRLLALSPDGETLLVSKYDYDTEREHLEILDLATGRSLIKITDHPSRMGEAAFSPDGELIVGTAAVKLWRARTGQLVYEYPSSGRYVQWAPDGKQLIAAYGLFQLENLSPGPVIVTAWIAPSNKRCAVGCPLCRCWVEIDIDDLGSEAQCAYCHENLRLNSFVIRAEWEPVAKVWRLEPKVQTAASASKRKKSR